MSSNTKSDLWKQCEVSNLTNHFHKYNNQLAQYDRLSNVKLSGNDISSLFGGDLNSFSVWMGLNGTSVTDEFTFLPNMTVNFKNGKNAQADFGEKSSVPLLTLTNLISPTNPSDSGSQAVPFEFVRWLCKNWMEIDMQYIDDVFVSTFEEGKGLLTPEMRTNKRVIAYHFSEFTNPNFYQFIAKYKDRIKEFIFHLGVDMNKYGHHNVFAFSPVFEVHISDVTKDDIFHIHRLGFKSHSVGNTNTEVVYYEYSAPCPPTCP